jgi:hypothetical protein
VNHDFYVSLKRVGVFLGSKRKYVPVTSVEIRWLNGVPVDKPVCGYTGELCITGSNNFIDI